MTVTVPVLLSWTEVVIPTMSRLPRDGLRAILLEALALAPETYYQVLVGKCQARDAIHVIAVENLELMLAVVPDRLRNGAVGVEEDRCEELRGTVARASAMTEETAVVVKIVAESVGAGRI